MLDHTNYIGYVKGYALSCLNVNYLKQKIGEVKIKPGSVCSQLKSTNFPNI